MGAFDLERAVEKMPLQINQDKGNMYWQLRKTTDGCAHIEISSYKFEVV